MESSGIAVDQNGKECTEIGYLSSVRDTEDATGAVEASMVVEYSDCDSVSTTKVIPDGIAIAGVDPVAEPHIMKEGKEKEDLGILGTEAEEQNETMDFSNLVASTNSNEDAKTSAIISLDTRNGSKLTSTGGIEQPERNVNIDSKSEVTVATSLGIEKSVALSDNSTTNPALISSLVITDCDKDISANASVQTEPEAPHSAPHRNGFPFRSTDNGEKSTTNPVSYQRKRILRSATRSDHQRSSSLFLSSLPIDSLHSIASFLKPIEWKNFGQCNKSTNKISREIFRRVRMHGFRCATEVVTAWVRYSFTALCALFYFSLSRHVHGQNEKYWKALVDNYTSSDLHCLFLFL